METYRGLEALLADREEIAKLITENKDLMKKVEELEKKEAELRERLDEVSAIYKRKREEEGRRKGEGPFLRPTRPRV